MEKEIRMPSTRYHKFVNLLSMILIITIFAYLIINWSRIPDSVPLHFNGAGEIDRWGRKNQLFICPVFALAIYVIISFLERHPSLWNTGVTVTKENQVRVYSILKNIIISTKFVAVLALCSITLCSALARPLPSWFTPGFLILMLSPMAFFSLMRYRKK